MFTGIVEATGRIATQRERPGGTRRIVVATSLPVGRLPVGASIAVDGACLTVVARRAGRFEADLGPETLAKTTLGSRRAGDRVHLERPLRLGDALGGHMVAGHVDGVGRVTSARRRGDTLRLRIAAPSDIVRLIAPKGSITVDGVSLTVNGVERNVFSVLLIPHTLAVTCLGERRSGDRVNIEADLLARHIDRLISQRGPSRARR